MADLVCSNPTTRTVSSSYFQAVMNSINSLLARVAAVCQKAMQTLRSSRATSLGLFVAIPIYSISIYALSLNPYYILALPIIFLAVSIFDIYVKGNIDEKEFDQELNIKTFHNIYIAIAINSYNSAKVIEVCKSLKDLKSNLAIIITNLQGYENNISQISFPDKCVFSDVFKPIEQLNCLLEDLESETNEETLADYKSIATVFITAITDSFKDAISNKLPAYIKLSKKSHQ
jgi:hypothetical protein